MTYDVEERLAVALRSRAEAPVDTDALLSGALAAGRARARRHRLVTAGGAGVAGLTAAALVGVPLALAPSDGGPAPDVGFVGDLPALPAAQGEPAAAQRPELVGSDPAVLRFGLDEAPLPVRSVDWGSVDGVEHIAMQMVDGGWGMSATVELGQGTLAPSEWDDPATANTSREVRVGGRPAVLEEESAAPGEVPRRWVRWSPLDGLELRVGLVLVSYQYPAPADTGVGLIDAVPPRASRLPSPVVADPAFLIDLAETVRLDATTRCAAPLRLTDVPDGARLTGCAAGGGVSPDSTLGAAHAMVMLEGADGTLRADAMAPFFPEPVPSESYVGNPGPSGSVVDNSPSGGVEVTGTPGPEASVSAPPSGVAQFDDAGVVGEVTATGGYGQRDAERVAAGVRAAGNPLEPSTWPLNPVG